MKFLTTLLGLMLLGMAGRAMAADWPEWRGAHRGGVWLEGDLPDRFPEGGLPPIWRSAVLSGFSSPVVADGRVYVSDWKAEQGRKGTERLLAFDESGGGLLWSVAWPADTTGIETHSYGPRATPTLNGSDIFVLGAAGDLLSVNASTGAINWKLNYQADFGSSIQAWGYASAPIVYGDLLIGLVGAEPDGKVVAFEKNTGRERWRALENSSGLGYSQPIVIRQGGVDQLIVYHAGGVASLDPEAGKLFWQIPYQPYLGLSIATPVYDQGYLFVSSYRDGPLMLRLEDMAPRATMLWRGASRNERKPDGLHSAISVAAIDGKHLYGVCGFGQLRCIDRDTGRLVWESQEATQRVSWSTAFLVRADDRYLITNEQGVLIMARLSPEGYREIDRTPIIEPTMSASPGKRDDRKVNWVHPAYANGHIFVRNDRELVRVPVTRTAIARSQAHAGGGKS